MKSNYKKLGPYIRVISIRNKDLKINKLIGLSIQKIFIPSISNTIGTDMSTYKIVRKNQFAYGPVTSRNGNKITIALSEEYKVAIISQAYTVFEITNHNELLPEYLMMWFRRPEFDRYARFKSHGSVREIFDWEEMCSVELPVPDIEKQKAIVKEYNTIVNRIKLNEQLNQKLEETAQAIYKEWFVDFEFPMTKEYAESIGKTELEGKAYKANGGEMVWNEELGGDIPKGWGVEPFTKVVNLKGGGTPSTAIENFWNGNIPFFTPSDISQSFYSIITEKSITQSGLQNCSSRLYPKDTVFVTARGTVGTVAIAGKKMAMNQSCYAILGCENFNQFFAHQLTLYTINKLKKEAVGAVFNALVTRDFDGQSVVEPTIEVVKLFGQRIQGIYDLVLSQSNQIISLHKMNDLILSKMTKV